MIAVQAHSTIVRPESSLCREERGVAGGDVTGARDVPLPRPRVLAVSAALQQQLPGALAVDPHVHRPVVVAVPVHLRPEESEASERRNHTIRSKESNRDGRVQLRTGACLGLETPVFSPAALRTSRCSSGAAAINTAALAADRVGVEWSEKAKRCWAIG